MSFGVDGCSWYRSRRGITVYFAAKRSFMDDVYVLEKSWRLYILGYLFVFFLHPGMRIPRVMMAGVWRW